MTVLSPTVVQVSLPLVLKNRRPYLTLFPSCSPLFFSWLMFGTRWQPWAVTAMLHAFPPSSTSTSESDAFS